MQVVMVWQKDAPDADSPDLEDTTAELRVFRSEQELLSAWLQLVQDKDPDALILFQVEADLALASHSATVDPSRDALLI